MRTPYSYRITYIVHMSIHYRTVLGTKAHYVVRTTVLTDYCKKLCLKKKDTRIAL